MTFSEKPKREDFVLWSDWLQHVNIWLERENAELRADLRILGQHTYGGLWLDHSSDCKLGETYESKCTCGLSDWLHRNAEHMGIKIGPVLQSCTDNSGDQP